MDTEGRSLIQEIADLYHPDDGDAMETALEASDRFTNSMSRSIAAHLAPAIFGLVAVKGIAIDDMIVCALPSHDGVFVLHVSDADSISDRRTISCWHTSSGEEDQPRQVASIIAVSERGCVRAVGWESIEDWSSILDLSRLLVPHSVNSLSGGRNGTICDRVIEADGGLPGDLVREALKIVIGRLVVAATSEARGGLDGIVLPDTTELGDGWKASGIDAQDEAVFFARAGGPSFAISSQEGNLSIDAHGHWITVSESGSVDFDVPPSNDLLFAVANALGRAAGYRQHLSSAVPAF